MSEQIFDKESEEDFFVNKSIQFVANPTFLPTIGWSTSDIFSQLKEHEVFSTMPFSFSPSDRELERNKTTEQNFRHLKNNLLQQIVIRPEKQVNISENYSRFVYGLDKEKMNLLDEELSILPSNILWRNWIDIIKEAPYLEFLPLRGYPAKDALMDALDVKLEKLSQQFKIINRPDFRKFLENISMIPTQLTGSIAKICNNVKSFLEQKGIAVSGIIDKEEDYEDETLKNVRIIFTVKNKNVDECIDLSEELLTHLAEIDKSSLENINLEIIPE